MANRAKHCPPRRATWTKIDIPCNKQSDGNSCGVFVLMVSGIKTRKLSCSYQVKFRR